MRLVAIIVICLVGQGLLEDDFPLEDGVLVLNPLNFDAALRQFSHLMVKFYAPWCKFSQALAPKYDRAAQQLMEMGSHIRLAELDAIGYAEFAKRNGIRQYPTMVFFESGTPIPYDGKHEQDAIVRWLLQKVSNDSEVDHVLELTVTNFHSTISSNPFVMVEFYAPWCPRCRKFAPKYAKAAQELFRKNSNIKLAKLDGTREKQLAYQQGIQRFPTLRLFRFSDIPLDYDGEREQTPLINWLLTNARPSISIHTTTSKPRSTIRTHQIIHHTDERQLDGTDRNSSRNPLPVLLNLLVMIMVSVVLTWP